MQSASQEIYAGRSGLCFETVESCLRSSVAHWRFDYWSILTEGRQRGNEGLLQTGVSTVIGESES